MASDLMINDEREIEWIEVCGNDDNVYTSREGTYKNCDAIEIYEDRGQMGLVPWLRVMKEGQVHVRISPALCAIGYKLKKGTGE